MSNVFDQFDASPTAVATAPAQGNVFDQFDASQATDTPETPPDNRSPIQKGASMAAGVVSGLAGTIPDVGNTISKLTGGSDVAKESYGSPSFQAYLRDKIDNATGGYTKMGDTVLEKGAPMMGSLLATPAPVGGEGAITAIGKSLIPNAGAAVGSGIAQKYAPDSTLANIALPVAGGAITGAIPAAAEAMTGAVKNPIMAAKKAASMLSAPNPEAATIGEASAAQKAVAGGFYKQAEDAGGVLSPKFTNNFLDTISGKPPETPTEVIAAKTDPVKMFAEEFAPIRDKPMSLTDADLIDKRLGDLIDAQYGVKGLTAQGRALSVAQDTFRDMIENAGPGEIQGGQQGFDALKQARAAWSQAMKMRDIEKIQMRALYSDNPATTIKSSIRTMLANPSKTRGYSPLEMNALKDAANTGIVTNALRVFGSRLVPLVAGGVGESIGGLPGAAIGGGIGHVGSTVARNAASNIQSGKLQNVLKVMGAK